MMNKDELGWEIAALLTGWSEQSEARYYAIYVDGEIRLTVSKDDAVQAFTMKLEEFKDGRSTGV